MFAPFGATINDGDSTRAYYSTAGTSYQYNACLVYVDDYKKISSVKSSGMTVLLNEWPAFDVLVNDQRPAWWTDKPRWSFHDNSGRGLEPDVEASGVGNDTYDEYGNNTVFVDGHVEYVDYDVSGSRQWLYLVQ
ncbi:MAG: hypothetical protein J7M40_13965 [Planctomycetes bacterium]|nr:hypothetical protein [Planctomycetota bacterium]